MTRRRGSPQQPPLDAIEGAIRADEGRVANDLTDALDMLQGLTDSELKVIIHRVNRAGTWGYVKTLFPPIDTDELVDELKEEYGPGTYSARIMANGRLRTHKQFSIAEGRSSKAALPGADTSKDMMTLFMGMSDRSRSEQGDMFKLMLMQQQENARQQSMQQNETTKLIVTMMTAMMGAPKENPAAMLTGFAELFKSVQGPASSIKETVETYTMLRDLNKPPEKDDKDEGLLAMGKELIGPMAGAALEAFSSLRANRAGGAPAQQPPAPMQLAAAPSLPPRQVLTPPPAVANDQAGGQEAPAAAPPAMAAGVEPHVLIQLIRPHVTYFMGADHDPELTADALADILDKNGVGMEQLLGLVMEIQAAGDQWPARLAEQGLDVTAKIEWFTAVVMGVYQRFTESAEDDDGAGGGTGGDSDPPNDAGPGVDGIDRHGDPQPGRGANGRFVAKGL